MSFAQIVTERFVATAGIEFLHVPFQGTGSATAAALGGQVELIALPPGPVLDQGGGAICRPIAITTETRLPALPETPTFREAGTRLVFLVWRGMFLPAATPAGTREALEQVQFQAVSCRIVQATLARLSETPALLDAAEFARLRAEDRAAIHAILPRLPRE